tara:strand:+ start:223 stop:1137 length:915 start_codon:yes stop_codon:yes gene_type:complete
MKVLITGGSGFLGHSLSRQLKDKGHEVVSLSSKDADLTKSNSLEYLNSSEFDLIFHLAAHTQAGDWSQFHSGEEWCVNQQINTTVLSWWVKSQPQAKLISMGTSCSYEEASIHEEKNYLLGDPRKELYTYAMTKRMLFIGQKAINRQHGLDYLSFIPSTLYGPHYNTDKKQLHFIFDLIFKIINFKKSGEPIVLWGNGHQRRELVYVEDFVSIMIDLSISQKNDLINIGAGEDYSIREFAQIICDKLEVDSSKIIYDEEQYVGAKSKVLDTKKLNNLIPNFKQVPLKDGLDLTIEAIIKKSKLL